MPNYLVIGGAGSIGAAFIKKVLNEDDKANVCVFSRSELHHHELKSALAEYKDRLGFYLGDIKDIEAIRRCVRATVPQYIVVTAAIKRIEVCEQQPLEAVAVNVTGVDNVCRVAAENDFVKTVVYTSTDKASDPIGVYGSTKAIAERIMRNYAELYPEKKFVTTRFANVLDSAGSVIPIFRNLIKNGKPLTVRGEMTRYFISQELAAQTIQHALTTARSGNILIPMCNSMKIVDLAEIMVEESGKKIPINIVEPLPFEKMHEVLVSKNGFSHLQTMNWSNEIKNYYYELDLNYHERNTLEEVASDSVKVLLSKEELRKILQEHKII